MSETETEAKQAAVQVFARAASGVEVNITEGVQALYDLVIGSMDWGSGFLTTEDALPVARVARVCGFERADEAERYVRTQEHNPQQAEFIRTRHPTWHAGQWNIPHDHVYSTADLCMWPGCDATQYPA